MRKRVGLRMCEEKKMGRERGMAISSSNSRYYTNAGAGSMMLLLLLLLAAFSLSLAEDSMQREEAISMANSSMLEALTSLANIEKDSLTDQCRTNLDIVQGSVRRSQGWIATNNVEEARRELMVGEGYLDPCMASMSALKMSDAYNVQNQLLQLSRIISFAIQLLDTAIVLPFLGISRIIPNIHIPNILGGVPNLPDVPNIPNIPNILGGVPNLPSIPNIPGGVPDLTSVPNFLGGLPNLPGIPNIPGGFPNLPDVPNILGRVSNLPGVPNIPGGVPNLPNVPYILGGGSNLPGIPNILGGIPNLPSIPNIPNIPEGVPNLPVIPNILGGVPNLPGVPNIPGGLPNLPDVPKIPGEVPNLPSIPNILGGVPNLPTIPNIPGGVPNLPGMPNIARGISNLPEIPNIPGKVPNLQGVLGASNIQGGGVLNLLDAPNIQGGVPNLPSVPNIRGGVPNLLDIPNIPGGVPNLQGVPNIPRGVTNLPDVPYIPRGVPNFPSIPNIPGGVPNLPSVPNTLGMPRISGVASTSSLTDSPQMLAPTTLSSLVVEFCANHATLRGNSAILRVDKSCGPRIRSTNKYTSGVFSARIRTPVKANGVITSFYISSNDGASDSISFDFLGNYPTRVITNYAANGHTGGNQVLIVLSFDTSVKFHTYTIKWDKESIVWMVDNIVLRTVTNSGERYPKKPGSMYLYSWDGSYVASGTYAGKVDWSRGPFSTYYTNIMVTSPLSYPGMWKAPESFTSSSANLVPVPMRPLAIDYCFNNVAVTTTEASIKFDKGGCGGRFRSIVKYPSGTFSTHVKCASGDTSGLLTSFYLSSQEGSGVQDEIDFEWLGKDMYGVQTNFYVNGIGGHEAHIPLGFDCSKAFHKYTIIYNSQQIQWLVDNKLVRTVTRAQQSVFNGPYPMKPVYVYASVWNASSVNRGLWTGKWSGANLPYIVNYSDITVQSP